MGFWFRVSFVSNEVSCELGGKCLGFFLGRRSFGLFCGSRSASSCFGFGRGFCRVPWRVRLQECLMRGDGAWSW